MWPFLLAIWQILVDVFCFWDKKVRGYLRSRNPVRVWIDALRNATEYEEWEAAALHLDKLLGLDMWRTNPISRDYDYRLIADRLELISAARQDGDLYALINLLRAGLVRNLGNITCPKLFNCCFGGTKHLIEEYIAQYSEAIRDIAALPPVSVSGGVVLKEPVWASSRDDGDGSGSSSGGGGGHGRDGTGATARALSPALKREGKSEGSKTMMMMTMSTQTKLDFIHDTRQGFGKTALVLQGGAIFGLCHLGVVKALYLRGLLPRIIVGTATGAIMAALVGVHPEEDLPRVLKGDGIDLSAFTSKGRDPVGHNIQVRQSMWTRWATLVRRVRRFRKEGYFLDVTVLEECIRTNVGDLTFEEAYNRSKRILNITVATAGQQGIPTLLNHVTAPNVLVWTAAVASNASSSTFYGHKQTKIMCKDSHGNIVPWKPATTVGFRHWTHASYTGRNSPLQRVAELFNVNHYIVSQARPYLIPFLQSDMHGPSVVGRRNKFTRLVSFLIQLTGSEVRHRLRQLDTLRLLSPSIRRFLVDEQVPGASMTLVPEVSPVEFVRLLETPTQETLDYWIRRGEQSVWPAVAALKIRCVIEMELDRAYQQVRRLKAGGLRRKASQQQHLAGMAAAGAAGGDGTKKGDGDAAAAAGAAAADDDDDNDRDGGGVGGPPRAWSIGDLQPAAGGSGLVGEKEGGSAPGSQAGGY